MRMIVKIVFAAGFATVAGYGIYANQKSNAMSDFTLANVEALARGEGDDKSQSESITITDLGTYKACKGNYMNDCHKYHQDCYGDGSLYCVNGTYSECTPTSLHCV